MGHSYGTTVVGYAARSSAELDTDEIVFVASPGVGVDSVDELKLHNAASPRDHVWATRAENDIIEWTINPAKDVLEGGFHYLRYGMDPIYPGSDGYPGFGARVFTSDPGPVTDPIGTHSAYWTDNNQFRRNFAKIITGRQDVT